MPDCPECGVSCRIEHTTDGETVPIENREEPLGPGRYRESEGGLVLLPDDFEEMAFVDHRVWCPTLTGYYG